MDLAALPLAIGGAALILARARRMSRGRSSRATETVALTVSGGCLCGGARYTYALAGGKDEDAPPQVLVCHCAMCRKAIGSSQGVAFAAMPRARVVWDHGGGGNDGEEDCGTLRVFRSSPFARRLFCGRCGSSLMIRYDCERYTDWVTVGTMDRGARWFGGHAPFAPQRSAHIHVDGAAAWENCPPDAGSGTIGYDGLLWYAGWDPWKIDVCRPEGSPEPEVCLGCFQLSAGCTCSRAEEGETTAF